MIVDERVDFAINMLLVIPVIGCKKKQCISTLENVYELTRNVSMINVIIV